MITGQVSNKEPAEFKPDILPLCTFCGMGWLFSRNNFIRLYYVI